MKRLTLLLAAVAVLPTAGTAQAAPAARPATCRERIAIECVRVSVPIDRTGRVAGTVPLYVERLGEDRRNTRALLFLAGGPGQAATPFVPDVAPALASVLSDRDVLLLDQRGTGRSGALKCAARRGATPRGQLAACASRLGPARNHYATADSVADIEAVRAALGIDQLTLYGTSYGTKVALEYAVAHPDHVEGLVLDSVVREGPVEALGRSSWSALGRILRQACRAGHCAGITADPVADLVAVEQRLAARPVLARRITSHGRVVRTRIKPGSAMELVFDGDFEPGLRAALPGALHAARANDLAPFTRLLEHFGAFAGGSVVSDPLFVATTCADDVFPWTPRASAMARRRAADAALARFARSGPLRVPPATLRFVSSLDPCTDWPPAPPPPVVGPLPDVPALVVSGDGDLRTPTEDARAVARRLPRSQLLVVRGTGHSVIGNTVKDCPGRALVAFLHGRRIRPCAARPLPALPPSLPRRLEQVRPWLGLTPAIGRIVRAARATLTDVRSDVLFSGFAATGGLRGGWYAPKFTTSLILDLHRVVSIAGLRVSGRVPLTGRAVLRVRTGSAKGTLTLSKRLITGRIGTTRVRAVIVP